MAAGAMLSPAEVLGSFDGPIGAYLHVPFCEWICPFCPYNKVLAREDLAQRYFEGAQWEVEQYLSAVSQPFTSLYVGGGTPTLYPDLLQALIAPIPFSGERAIEVLPLHGTVERLDGLRTAGFTAVSIGAQSFHDAVLQRLRRPHDAAQALAAVHNAVGRFDCVDVDLIVDVALEDQPDLAGAFLEDVRTCFALGVDQVSTYPLMRFGYTPFGRARHDRRQEHRVLGQVSELAARMGYERRSVWTFNRKGAAPYTSITRRRFLGMGAGSSSFAGRDFYVNHFGVQTYLQAVADGRLPIARHLHLGGAAGMAYDAFWQAYAGGISPLSLRESYGMWAGAVPWALAPGVALGHLQRSNGDYLLTSRGFDHYHDLERWVTYRFIEPLWAQMLREHAAEGSHVPWAETAKARSSLPWRLARRLLERPVV